MAPQLCCRELQEKYGVATNRFIPDWGKQIFSELCICSRPSSPTEVAAFLKYAIGLANFQAQIGRLAGPVGSGGSGAGSEARRLADIRAGHERYVAKQLENDKTRKVLEKSFGAEASEDYMRSVMFDVPSE